MYAGMRNYPIHDESKELMIEHCVAGMGVMLATIWIHLGTDASTINDRLSVHFYSIAFLAFSKYLELCYLRNERQSCLSCCSWLAWWLVYSVRSGYPWLYDMWEAAPNW